MEQNWQPILEPILRQAGEILLSYYNKPLSHHEKISGGFVTEADVSSEKFLIEQLLTALPTASIWAEESGKTGQKSDYCWVIDPLDGTTNFAHGLPYFCISVALTCNNIPYVGAIYQPMTDEFFYAQTGVGAFLNGKPISVSAAQFNQALVSIGLPYRKPEQESLITRAKQIMQESYTIRHCGAIALDLAYVACGKMDGVFLSQLAWWDIAAGTVLIEQAGGIVTDFGGKPLNPDYTTAIAGGKIVYNHMALLLSD